MAYNKNHKSWIENFLIPELIKTNKFAVTKNLSKFVKLKSFEIEQMSHEVAFMLTYCYFVKIVLEFEEHGPAEEQIQTEGNTFHLVVKVRSKMNLVLCMWMWNPDIFRGCSCLNVSNSQMTPIDTHNIVENGETNSYFCGWN